MCACCPQPLSSTIACALPATDLTGIHRPGLLEDTDDDAALQEVPTVVFNQTYFRTHSEAHVRDWVRHMLRQSRAIMPHFAGELSKDEIRHIIAYLRSLP